MACSVGIQARQLLGRIAKGLRCCRIVTDRETGAPKGFGFCEYNDVATASRAQRELNHVEMGGRNIHVDFAEDKERPGPGGAPPLLPLAPLCPGSPVWHHGSKNMLAFLSSLKASFPGSK